MARAGRRPGSTDTRVAILDAARTLFAERGYDGATIRSIAAEADVNPALVHHFFGSKEQVFVTALQLPIVPAELVPRLLDGPREEAGRRVVATILDVWAEPAGRESLLAVLRSSMTNERVAAMLREFLRTALVGRVAEAFAVPPLRVTGAVGQLFGLMLLRYVLQVEPLASASPADLVDLVGPTIQAYLDGD